MRHALTAAALTAVWLAAFALATPVLAAAALLRRYRAWRGRRSPVAASALVTAPLVPPTPPTALTGHGEAVLALQGLTHLTTHRLRQTIFAGGPGSAPPPA